jgi:hypothetical protein
MLHRLRQWFLSLDPDRHVYGVALATRVADLLDGGGSIRDSHAYYCGTGFVRDGGLYCWAHIDEGYCGEHLRSFERREDFIAWLAQESDHSLSHSEGGSGRLQIPGGLRMRAETRRL